MVAQLPSCGSQANTLLCNVLSAVADRNMCDSCCLASSRNMPGRCLQCTGMHGATPCMAFTAMQWCVSATCRLHAHMPFHIQERDKTWGNMSTCRFLSSIYLDTIHPDPVGRLLLAGARLWAVLCVL